jgi:hypothetical protein
MQASSFGADSNFLPAASMLFEQINPQARHAAGGPTAFGNRITSD